MSCHFRPNIRRMKRWVALLVASLYSTTCLVAAAPAARATGTTPRVIYKFDVPKSGEHVTLYDNGTAQIFSKDYQRVEYRQYPSTSQYLVGEPGATWLPNKAKLLSDLITDEKTPFAPHRVVVVFRPGVAGTQNVVTVSKNVLLHLRKEKASGATVPQYTSDPLTNRLLAKLGVARSERLFRTFDRSSLGSIRAAAQAHIGHALLPFENTYRLEVTNASVRHAVRALLHSTSVLYASPDWYVAPLDVPSIPIPRGAAAVQSLSSPRFIRSIRSQAATSTGYQLPSNYAISASAQSSLNAPGIDATAAYDEIGRAFHQLPGQGEIITNVSTGDLDDATSPMPCAWEVLVFGATTTIINGQRYIDWPSMPLIPAYTADPNGNLSGTATECGQDFSLGEVGLDFSMMAPLPHDQQRAAEQGSGYSDLLGIAPGAQYRLVVPSEMQPTMSDVDAAFLGAAMQTPKPDVITASLGFGLDSYGFPGRFLEDDPVTAAIIASIVSQRDIVVCISSGDGTRTYTNAAIGPSGGSAATNEIAPGGTPTNLNDVAFSTVPSDDYDTGSIDVGGSTLDDIFSAPPQYAAGTAAAQHAYPETRWTGFTSFSSGFGSRVNISAPSDNVLAMQHYGCFFCDSPYDSVSVGLSGGTSAAAPEVAAAAAVALQVARLSGRPFHNVLDVRKFLAQTATPIPNVSQADVPLNVGPQLNLRNAVETLLREGGMPVKPSVARVAIEQRRNVGLLDAAFVTGTDPTNIDLQGSAAGADGSDADEDAWITIAPDWEGMPAGTTYRLSVGASAASSAAHIADVQSLRRVSRSALHLESTGVSVLATTPWARLLPVKILQAAGLPLASSSSRTVQLTYQAQTGAHVLTSVTFALTFGPADATTTTALAPQVSPVVTGSTFPVAYDLSDVRNVSNPTLVVSEPGRIDPATGLMFHPSYTKALTAPKGTVDVPVSALQGSGIYGIGILTGTYQQYGQTYGIYSDFAFTRVASAGVARPRAPLLGVSGVDAQASHSLEISYGTPFTVSWDASNVPGATGAVLEISDAAPSVMGSYNVFNNPNGNARDNNGQDSGSVYYVPLPGLRGTTTLDPFSVGLVAAMEQQVRVVATHGDVVVGESSDVSTVAMDGIIPADGGNVGSYGFAINPSAGDGFFSSTVSINEVPLPEYFFSPFATFSSLETFNQKTATVTSTVSADNNNDSDFYVLGAYANDLGLYDNWNNQSQSDAWGMLNPVATGAASSWSLPTGQSITDAAVNYANDQAAFFGYNSQLGGLEFFESNLSANSFTAPININGALNQVLFGFPIGLAQNTNTNEGVIAAASLLMCSPPLFITANPSSGALQTANGSGSTNFFGAYGVAVDSMSNKAAINTGGCSSGTGISIMDLNTGTNSEASLPGYTPIFITDDDVHGLFLIAEELYDSPRRDNNAKGAILVVDQTGALKGVYPDINLDGIFLWLNRNNLQVNPNTRTAYTIGPLGQELEPIKY